MRSHGVFFVIDLAIFASSTSRLKSSQTSYKYYAHLVNFCMRRDSIFYKLFQQSPNLLFELFANPPANADQYRFDLVAVKEPKFEIDGVFTSARTCNFWSSLFLCWRSLPEARYSFNKTNRFMNESLPNCIYISTAIVTDLVTYTSSSSIHRAV